MIVCSRCGNSNPDGTRFCRRCGAALQAAKPLGNTTTAAEAEREAAAEAEAARIAAVKAEADRAAAVKAEAEQSAAKAEADRAAAEKIEADRAAAGKTEAERTAAAITVRADAIKAEAEQSAVAIKAAAQRVAAETRAEAEQVAALIRTDAQKAAAAQRSSNWLIPIAGSLLLAGAAGFTGYKMGQTDNKKLTMQVKSVKGNLQSLEEKARDQAFTLATQAASLADKEKHLHQVEEQAAKQQLKVSTDLASRDNDLRQLNEQLRIAKAKSDRDIALKEKEIAQLKVSSDSSAQVVTQLGRELKAKQTEAADFRQRLEAEGRRQRFGSFAWTGDLKGNTNVEIKDGHATFGTLAGNLLPGVTCNVLAADPDRVSISTPPGPANNWNQMIFNVRGKGRTTVRFFWGVN